MKHDTSDSFSRSASIANREKRRNSRALSSHHSSGALDRLDRVISSVSLWERIKWKLDTQSSGRDFVDYIEAKQFEYRIQHLFLICSETGALLQQISLNDNEHSTDRFSGVLTAVRSYAIEEFTSASPGSGKFSLDGYEVLMESGKSATLAAASIGQPCQTYMELMRSVLADIHLELGGNLSDFSGDTESLAPSLQPMLRQLLIEKKFAASQSRWRAWLVIWLVSVGIILGVFFSARDLIYRSKIEKAIATEPGIEVLNWRNHWFSKNKIAILRDPKAKPLADVFAAANVPIDWRQVRETSFMSLEEPFASARERESRQREAEIYDHNRAEVAALYHNFKKLSSEAARKEDHLSLIRTEFFREFPIADTAELIHLGDDKWEVVGMAPEPYFSSIVRHQKDLIIGGGSVSLKQFKRDTKRGVQSLRSQIGELMITYRPGELSVSSDGLRARSLIIEKLRQLVMFHQANSMAPPKIAFHATPILGSRKGDNVSLASARLRAEVAAIKKSLAGSDIEISTFLDNVQIPGKAGVYLVVE